MLEGRKKNTHRRSITLIKTVWLKREKVIVPLPENCIYLPFMKNIKQFLFFATVVRNFHYSYFFTVKTVLFL